jgi:hypothetical protein
MVEVPIRAGGAAALRPALRDRPDLAPRLRAGGRGRGRRARLKAWSLHQAENVVHRAGGLPVALPALIGRAAANDPVDVIRRAYAARYWRTAAWPGAGALAAALAAWPLAAPLAAAWFTVRNGQAVARACGKSRLRQAAEQLGLALGHGVLPPWYYVFELWDADAGRGAGRYLNRFEMKRGVYPLLRPKQPVSPLEDKAAFAAWCQGHQVQTIPVLGVARQGALRGPDGGAVRLPPRDLFVKLNCGRGGRDAERWDWRDGAYLRPDGQTLDEAGLKARLVDLSWGADRLLQERLCNAPELADLSNGALVTVRMLSCLDEDGRPEVTDAALRMAVGANCTVDNFHAGGLAAAIEVASGEISPATGLGMGRPCARIERHPDTGAPIAGRSFPRWAEMLDFVRRAHLAFCDHVIVGWDVALAADGPRLVEGNHAPDTDIHQRVSRTPLGDGRFAQLCAHHLRARGL